MEEKERGKSFVNIVNNSRHLSADMIWILLILLFPIAGTLAYLLMGMNLLRSKTARNLYMENKAAKKYFIQDAEVIHAGL